MSSSNKRAAGRARGGATSRADPAALARTKRNPSKVPPGGDYGSGEEGFVYCGPPHLGDYLELFEEDLSPAGGAWWPTQIDRLGAYRTGTPDDPAPFETAHVRFGVPGPLDNAGPKLHARSHLVFLKEDFGVTWVSKPGEEASVGLGFKVPEGTMAEADGDGPGLLGKRIKVAFDVGGSTQMFAGVVEKFSWCHSLPGESERLACHRIHFTDGSRSWHSLDDQCWQQSLRCYSSFKAIRYK